MALNKAIIEAIAGKDLVAADAEFKRHYEGLVAQGKDIRYLRRERIAYAFLSCG